MAYFENMDHTFEAQFSEAVNIGGSGTGADGASAYEIAVKNGFEGTEKEWLASLEGEPGKDGADGKDGYTPIKGIDYFTPEEIEEIARLAAQLVNEFKTFTVNFFNYDGTLLKTVTNVKNGSTVEYDGETPVRPNASAMEDWEFIGWDPEPVNITGDMDCVAQFKNNVSYARLLVRRAISGEYVNDRVTTIGGFSMNRMSNLTSVTFKSALTVGEYAFETDAGLIKADFHAVTRINGYAFRYDVALKTLIIRTDGICQLSATTAFSDTPLKTGYIYVPSQYLSGYQAATNWSTYADRFRALESFTVDGTIYGELDETKI